MIEICNLDFSHSGKDIIRNLSLNIPTGTGLRISGQNGVGKSTLFSLIVGQLRADSGEIRINSLPVQDIPKQEVFKLISVMDQTSQTESMILVSNLLKHLDFLDQSDPIFDEFELTSTFNTPVAKLSGGQKQRLFFAIAVRKSANVFIFDEPTSNQDDFGQKIIETKVKELIAAGKTVIVISHFGFDYLPTFEMSKAI